MDSIISIVRRYADNSDNTVLLLIFCFALLIATVLALSFAKAMENSSSKEIRDMQSSVILYSNLLSGIFIQKERGNHEELLRAMGAVYCIATLEIKEIIDKGLYITEIEKLESMCKDILKRLEDKSSNRMLVIDKNHKQSLGTFIRNSIFMPRIILGYAFAGIILVVGLIIFTSHGARAMDILMLTIINLTIVKVALNLCVGFGRCRGNLFAGDKMNFKVLAEMVAVLTIAVITLFLTNLLITYVVAIAMLLSSIHYTHFEEVNQHIQKFRESRKSKVEKKSI